MATETHLATRQFRLQQWTAMVQECNSRPAGMKVTEWCREHGITKDAYYYRLNCVRKACLDTMKIGIPEDQTVVNVPASLLEQVSPASSGIDISWGQAVIHVNEQTSPELLAMVVRVMSHAE